MKKLLLLIALMMPIALYAQEQKEKSSSKTVEFLSKDGSFQVLRVFYGIIHRQT